MRSNVIWIHLVKRPTIFNSSPYTWLKSTLINHFYSTLEAGQSTINLFLLTLCEKTSPLVQVKWMWFWYLCQLLATLASNPQWEQSRRTWSQSKTANQRSCVQTCCLCLWSDHHPLGHLSSVDSFLSCRCSEQGYWHPACYAIAVEEQEK